MTSLTDNLKIELMYKNWTIARKTKTGYTIKCKKGLWRVDAPSKRKAESEAMHYFAQYYADGEYSNKLPTNQHPLLVGLERD